MSNFIQTSALDTLTSYRCSEKLEVTLSRLHADGVISKEFIRAGDTIFSEKPLCFLQTLPNAQDVIVCGGCQTIIGAMDIQVGILNKTLSREDINTKEGSCQCQAKCGVLYCSDQCNSHHWNRGHKLLCTGNITEEDAAHSPLIQFKMHACATNEIFLLVAEVFASICCEIEAKRKEEFSDDAAIITSALHPYCTFVRNPWWDVAIPTINQSATNDDESPVKFAQTLQQLVFESWEMLRQVLDLEGRGLSEILNIEYMARTIGMFEQNNIGVQCQHPLAATVSSLGPSTPLVGIFLSAAEKISQYLEAQEECDDNWMNESDEEEESEEENMGECNGEDDCGHNHSNEAMDEQELFDVDTGDLSLNKLNAILKEYGADNIFPPLDGTALYSTLCKINHSCDPNVKVKYVFTQEYGLVAKLTALKDIISGAELLQSYIDQTMGTTERQVALADYGFRCTCEKCSVL